MHVFVSHSKKDNTIVKKIVNVLEKFNVDFWVDFNQIQEGDAIIGEINKGFKHATHFFLIWSKNASESEWVKKEVNAASSSDYTKKLVKIPFRVDDESLPAIDFSSATYHRINLENVTSITEDLLGKITDDLKTQIKLHKKKIISHYETFSENPIVSNFRKFDGHKYYIRQHYENLPSEGTGSDIIENTLRLIQENLKKIDLEKVLTKELNEDKQKFEQIVNNTKILRRRKHFDSKSLAKLTSKKDIDKSTIQKINQAEKLHHNITSKIDKLKELTLEKLIPIVGDYGSGKSAFCHHLLYQLCKVDDDSIIPVFIPLGQLQKRNTMENFLIRDIFNFIKNNYQFNISENDFNELVSKGRLIFILDALDEMSTRLDNTIAQNNLNHSIKLAKNNVVVLTSRHTYISKDMEKKLFEYDRLIKIKDFTNDEIKKFLRRYIKDDEERIDQISHVVDDERMSTLARKPLFLYIIYNHFNKLKKYFVINESVILKTLTEEWIKHDAKVQQETDVIKQNKIIDSRQRISEVLASASYKTGMPIGIDDIKSEVSEELRYDDSETDAAEKLLEYYNDAIHSTFLIKEGNEKYRFIVNPVMEYFVASRIINDIRKGRITSILDHVDSIRTEETFDFIRGIIELEWAIKPHVLKQISSDNPELNTLKSFENKNEILYDIIIKTKNDHRKPNVSNLVRILDITRNLPNKPNFTNLNLSDVHLSNSNLKNAILIEANLERSDLSGSDLSGADLSHANLSYANLSRCNLTETVLYDVKLNHTELFGARAFNTNFEECELFTSKTRGIMVNEQTKTTNIKIVREQDLQSPITIKEVLNQLDPEFRNLILRDNPKYRLKKQK